MINFKTHLIVSYNSENIKLAREKLKEIIIGIKEDVSGIEDIYIDEEKERLFDKNDLR